MGRVAALLLALLVATLPGSARALESHEAHGDGADARGPTPRFAIAPADPPPRPRGLLVWIPATDSGAPPPAWLPVLERHGLVWIGANRAGSGASPPVRLARALQARRKALWRWQDPRPRTVVAGFGHGARLAAQLLVAAPELFEGALLFADAGSWRAVPASDPGREPWPAAFGPPTPERLRGARTRPLAFLVGTRDTRAPRVRDVHAAWRGDGFERTLLLEIPDLDHAPPPADAFERALGHVGLASPDGP
jgi:hypothetical protein